MVPVRRPASRLLSPGDLPEPAELFDGVNEEVWIEVIQKMDEVYNDLLQYEVALEDKNHELEQSHQFIESVLSSMSDVLIVCDRYGLVLDVNAALRRFTGLSEESLKGVSVFGLFAEGASQEAARQLFSNSPSQESHDFELCLRASDGGAFPFSVNCTPRLSGTGKFSGMVITGRPVGELKKAYTALREAHEELKRTQQQLLHSEKMASLGRLVAGVAHELNNPISFVLGNVFSLQRYALRLQTYLTRVHEKPLANDPELLAMRRELKIDRALEDLKPLLEAMVEGSERTRDIVSGLKRFSAIDREARESFDLVEVVERAVQWVSKAGASSVEVALELPPAMNMHGSPGQIQQVLMNLVQNALDAVEATPRPAIRIIGEKAGEGWQLRVIDNGAGIAPENLPHLFEPFFTTKPVGRGTGLGLSISYGIVERHGGSLTVRNGEAGGAEFCLRLPGPPRPG
jgi:two-component system, NtrC family, sensor histidine kinase HupT/HoxJ